MYIAGGIILYLVLLVVLGTLTFRKGHMALFVIGFFLPICWLVGALIQPAPAKAA